LLTLVLKEGIMRSSKNSGLIVFSVVSLSDGYNFVFEA